MSRISESEIKERISRYLSAEENLVTVGNFKKIPSTSLLLLTRGMAWVFAQEFYVAVTDQRIIILPMSKKFHIKGIGEDVLYAGFDEVDFYEDPLKNTILDIRKTIAGEPLKLRFKSGFQFQGQDQFDFITAVKQRKQPGK